MIIVIEWVVKGIPQNEFSPYITNGGENGKGLMLCEGGKPVIFSNRKKARKYAKNYLVEQKNTEHAN